MTETTEALLPTAPSKRKQKHAGAHVQFFMDRALYKRMQAHAKSEGITTVGWIRRAAIKELRRSKAAA